MPLFWTDSIALCYSDLAAAKRWWIQSSIARKRRYLTIGNCTLQSDVALRLLGHKVPTILLSDWTEVRLRQRS